MKWIPDPSGRFAERPYFDAGEIDGECEAVIYRFLREQRGTKKVEFPVTTDELTVLIEQETDDVDWYADLSSEGDQVQGMTVFAPNSLPTVSISEDLSEPHRENRLRTTITHELGHVKFHTHLWALKHAQGDLFNPVKIDEGPRCHRDTILGSYQVDWMEWQAGYACGAYLMPITPLRKLVANVCREKRLIPTTISSDSDLGQNVIRLVQQHFQVSQEAAYVRLIKTGLIVDPPSGQNALRFN